MTTPLTIVLLGALVFTQGCSRQPQHASKTSMSADEPMVPASRARSAAEQIAAARCAREQRCGNIGLDETFSSTHDCLTRIQNDWKEDLGSRECAEGIEQDELSECLTEVRAESCDNPFDTLSRISQCTRSQICD